VTMTIINGSSLRPETNADSLWMISKNSGMKYIGRKTAVPAQTVSTNRMMISFEPIYSRGISLCSSDVPMVYLCCAASMMNTTPAVTNRPIIDPEFHGNRRPPKEIAISKLDMAPKRSIAPTQSIRAQRLTKLRLG